MNDRVYSRLHKKKFTFTREGKKYSAYLGNAIAILTDSYTQNESLLSHEEMKDFLKDITVFKLSSPCNCKDKKNKSE